MENTSSKGSENIEKTNYMGNKDIKVRKRGRPPKKKESPPEPKEIVKNEEYYINWIHENRKDFFNTSKKSKEFYDGLYEAHNFLFNSNKVRGKCGICDYNIIIDMKRKYFE